MIAALICGTALKLAVYTSTAEVRALAQYGTGVAVATTGGLVVVEGEKERVWTTVDGLPSNEVHAVRAIPGGVQGWTPRGAFTLGGRGVQRLAKALAAPKKPLRLVIKGRPLEVPDAGTHVAAVAVQGERAWAGLFGSGVWQWDGRAWTGPITPPASREVTALLALKDDLWIGTRREGLWRLREGRVEQVHRPAWSGHNAQTMALVGAELWIGTLTDGIQTLNPIEGERGRLPDFGTRVSEIVALAGGLPLVRDGDGRLMGKGGKRLALTPRPATSLNPAGADLLIGQYGGWTEIHDGRAVPRLDIADLKGLAPTRIVRWNGHLAVGTQTRGLLLLSGSDAGQWIDEGRGLGDDWITALARYQERLYAGTFVGGLAEIHEGQVTRRFLEGENVTALCEAAGQLFVATRSSVFRFDGTSMQDLSKLVAGLAPEAQALASDGTRLFIGTRAGIYVLWL